MRFMTDIHAQIRAFLQQQTVMPFSGREDSAHYTKAGLVPFITARDPLFYVMKPLTKHPDLGAPPFQLCKGTRQYYHHGQWRDMRGGWEEDGQKEELIETALREGIEELGLVLGNIRQLIDMGAHAFTSASTGTKKHMWLFAVEVKSPDRFLPDADVANTTSERKWIGAAEFSVVGRLDHRYVLTKMAGEKPFIL
jgi:hypothetical protein